MIASPRPNESHSFHNSEIVGWEIPLNFEMILLVFFPSPKKSISEVTGPEQNQQLENIGDENNE